LEEILGRKNGFKLFKAGENYVLSALTGSYGLYSVEIVLSKEEKNQYLSIGEQFICELAGDVTRFPQKYSDRQISKNHELYPLSKRV
jgi:hypothetical protein